MGKEIKGTSPILHGKTNVNGKQILTENKLKSKNEPNGPGKLKQRSFKKAGGPGKLRQRSLKKGGKV